MSATQQRVGAHGEVRVQELLGDPDPRHADGCCSLLLGDQAREAGLTHEPLNTLAADPLAVIEDEVRRALGDP
jgi:hypothetical protein